MHADQDARQAGVRLDESDRDLQQLDREQVQREAVHRRRAVAERPDDEHERQREGDVGRDRVHVLQDLRVQAAARASSASPACGPAPVVTMPTRIVTRTTTLVIQRDDGEPSRNRADARTGRPRRRAPGTTSCSATSTIDVDEVHADHPPGRPVSTVMPPRIAWNGTPRPAMRASQNRSRARAVQLDDLEEGDDRQDRQHAAEHAVAELDDAVDAHLGRVDEGVGRALRPGRAAEAAGGEAHRAAGARPASTCAAR